MSDVQTNRPSGVLAAMWIVPVIMGVLVIIAGLILIFDHNVGVHTLAILAGLSLLIAGVVDLVAPDRFPARWMGYASGAIGVIAGILAIAWPGVTLLVIAWITGIGLILGGIVRIAFGFGAEGSGGAKTLVIIGGVLSLVFGVLAIAWPHVTVVVLAIVLGIRAVIFGVVEIGVGLALRSAVKAD